MHSACYFFDSIFLFTINARSVPRYWKKLKFWIFFLREKVFCRLLVSSKQKAPTVAGWGFIIASCEPVILILGDSSDFRAVNLKSHQFGLTLYRFDYPMVAWSK